MDGGIVSIDWNWWFGVWFFVCWFCCGWENVLLENKVIEGGGVKEV